MATMIHYSDGRSIPSVIAIWDDMSAPAGYYRAYWVSETDPDGNGSPVVGYCSPGGSHRTIRATIAEARRLGYSDPVFRNGKRIA